MAETLPSPPPSPIIDDDQSIDEQQLSDKLDALLESYLDLLDTYTDLRESLSKSCSSGFLNLAQAQRHANSTIGVGRRFGQEGYDERMKGLRRVKVDDHPRFSVAKLEISEETDESKSDSQGSEIATAAPIRPKIDPAYRDPLTWFGILVPPALRQTQSHFTTVVEHTIPKLLNVEQQMRSLEEKIWHLRDEMGILDNYTQDQHKAADQEEK